MKISPYTWSPSLAPTVARLNEDLSVADSPRPLGVKLMTSDPHARLVGAIGATLPGAARQRCRAHCTTNLMAVAPKASRPWSAPC